MPAFNRVILIGYSTRDIELKHTQGGTAVCEMGLAINEKRKHGDETIEETVFVDVTLWGRTAEIAAEWVRKGNETCIEGRLKLDQWTDSGGQKKSKLKVVGERLVLMGNKGDKQEPPAKQDKPRPPRNAPIEGDDIPF